jgi:peptidoglycan-associated lipoprotein
MIKPAMSLMNRLLMPMGRRRCLDIQKIDLVIAGIYSGTQMTQGGSIMKRFNLVILLAPALFVGAVGCAHKRATKDDNAWAKNFGANGAAELDCSSLKVHFDYDSAELQDAAKETLETKVGCVKQNPKLVVVIEGNTDERGTEEYNMALGDRRALAVSKFMQALGAPGLQVRTVSYGEAQPDCEDHNEACWYQNRRAAINMGASKKHD